MLAANLQEDADTKTQKEMQKRLLFVALPPLSSASQEMIIFPNHQPNVVRGLRPGTRSFAVWGNHQLLGVIALDAPNCVTKL